MGFEVDLDKLADRLRRTWLQQLGADGSQVPFDKLQPSEQYRWCELADAARVEIATQVATYEMRDESSSRPRAQLPADRYDGATATIEDKPRLDKQLQVVLDFMLDGEWRTPSAIEEATGVEWASASARLRDLRKEKFGSFVVERESRGKGLFAYRVLPPAPKADLFENAGLVEGARSSSR